MKKLSFRPSPAMIVACLALVIALGGTATAVTYVVSSNSQIGPGTVSGHKPPTGKHANIIANSINGKDIADRSGVDTCKAPLTAKYGPICVGSDGGARVWQAANNYCNGYGLRLPTLGEATALARNYDVPGVNPFSSSNGPFYFWTDDYYYQGANKSAAIVTEDGAVNDKLIDDGTPLGTVCVTDPSA